MLYFNAKSLIPGSGNGISAWSIYTLLPQLTAIFIVTGILMLLILAYNRALKKTAIDEAPRGIVLIAELIIKWSENQVTDLLGMKYKKVSVYFLFLLLYLGIGNLLGLIGFDSQVSDYMIPFTLGLVAFFGIYYFGFKYQKLAFFKRYLLNPLDVFQQFVPLISLTFRLFGNVLGGTILLLLLTSFLNYLWGHIPYIGPVDLLAGIFLPFFSIYFDIFDGLIQAYVFAILTIAYWSNEMEAGLQMAKKGVVERVETNANASTHGSRTAQLLIDYQTRNK